MIRSKTTFVIGAGASAELQMPGGAELLGRVAQGFDFSRFGTELQTKDSVTLGQYLGKLGVRLGKKEEQVSQAADRIRIACKLCASIDSLLEQYSDDPLITACGKLAIVHFISQAEAKSLLRLTPRIAGDLPIQGVDNWLFQFAQLVTAGVSRSRVEKCFDDITVISFNYDRSLEHFMPHALVMAYGMPLVEAQRLVGAKLNVIHPYGSIGRLPWQGGDAPDSEWATEQPWNIQNLSMHIRTASEAQRDQTTVRALRAAISGAKRLVFLGFGFQPQNIDLLIDYGLSHDPEIMATTWGSTPLVKNMIQRMLRRKTGIEREDLIMMLDLRAYEVLRDFAMLLES